MIFNGAKETQLNLHIPFQYEVHLLNFIVFYIFLFSFQEMNFYLVYTIKTNFFFLVIISYYLIIKH